MNNYVMMMMMMIVMKPVATIKIICIGRNHRMDFLLLLNI